MAGKGRHQTGPDCFARVGCGTTAIWIARLAPHPAFAPIVRILFLRMKWATAQPAPSPSKGAWYFEGKKS